MSYDTTPDPYADPLVFGQRMQILRTRRGLTRDRLGGLLGRSASWVKAVETGRLRTPHLPVVLRVAEVLRVRNLSELTGDQSLPADLFAGPGHPRFAEVRAALNSLNLGPAPEAPPAAHLTARLSRAWSARPSAPYPATGR
ncbi:helix-turn-helix domain-containing protein [Streptomyces sp. NPDC005180]|uniref:helix-turn-helix domain-containing protein n=1 Tax=Streptomyces sp. NPDC005180 TaxID=3156868 RepID=UPI0033BF7B4F